MSAVSVCAQLQFNRSCHGVSTVFSYSIRTFANELQLQATVPEPGEGQEVRREGEEVRMGMGRRMKSRGWNVEKVSRGSRRGQR